MEELPDDLTGDQLFQVQQLLQGYDDVFSYGAFDMVRTTLVEHSIDTGSQRASVLFGKGFIGIR